MAALRALLLACALPLPPAIAEDSWQYFCFESAAQFAAISPKTVFSVFPNPSAVVAAAANPAPASAVEEAPAAEEAAPAAAQSEDELIAAQLRELKGTCYFMRVGYWTYEVCPFSKVRQYHSESGGGGGEATHSEFSLGTHLPERDEWQTAPPMFLQRFAGGTEGRSAVVQYVCPESWRDEDGIVIVHEPKAKEYEVHVRLHAACRSQPASAASRGKGSAAKAKAKAKADAVRATGAAAGAAAEAAGAAAAAAEGQGPVQIAELITPQTRLLASIRGRCFTMTRDYWTYELCPMNSMRQYHKEGNRVGAEFSLGKYEPAADKVTVGVKGRFDKDFVPHVFAQSYVNGTSSRSTQVRVRCSSKNEHTLLAIDEPETHQYVVLFSSPLACELSCAYSLAQVPENVGDSDYYERDMSVTTG